MSIARLMQMGAAGAAGGAGLEVNFEAFGTQTGFRATDYSFSVTLTNPPASGRELYVVLPLIPSSGTDIIGVTWRGNPMTEVYQYTNGSRGCVGFFKIADDTNSSGTLAIDVDNLNNHIGEAYAMFSVYNGSFSSGYGTDILDASATLNTTTSSGDAILWANVTRNGQSMQSVSTSPSVTVTQIYDQDLNSDEWFCQGWVSPTDMTTSLSSITRTMSGIASGDAVFSAIVLTSA